MKGMSISNSEILKIISEEGDNFQRRVSQKILGNKIGSITMKIANRVDPSINQSNEAIGLLCNDFNTNIIPTIEGSLKRSLENGTYGDSYISRVASAANKYTSQETYYRTNEIKKILLPKGSLTEENQDRSEIIKKIQNAFESDDLNLSLSESMNEEVEELDGDEENSIVEAAVDSVKTDIDNAEEKAEATRVIIDELKDTSEKYKEQEDAIKPNPEETTEHLKFDTNEFIKNYIPITAERFALEAEKGSFTKHKIMDFLLTLEDHGNYDEDVVFVSKRINAIKQDVIEKVPLGTISESATDAVNGLQNIFDTAKSDVDGVFSAFRMLSFGRGDLPAGKTDPDTLNLISKMADLRSTSPDKRSSEVQILIDTDPKPIVEASDFLDRSFETFQIRSTMSKDIADYDKYARAIELREDQIGEFMIRGMEHIPHDRAVRLKELAGGLKKIGIHDGLRQFSPTRLKAIYYKTALVAKPEDLQASNGKLINFNEEASRVKEIVSKTYKTDAYNEIVDDYFNNKGTSITPRVSEENLYEVFAYKSGMDVTMEHGSIGDSDRTNIKGYSKVYTSYYRALECLGLVDKSDLKQLAKNVRDYVKSKKK